MALKYRAEQEDRLVQAQEEELTRRLEALIWVAKVQRAELDYAQRMSQVRP